MAVWVHLKKTSYLGSYHLATHDRIGENPGDDRPLFSERETRHGYSLCGLEIDNEHETLYDPKWTGSPYLTFLCGNCKRHYDKATNVH